MRGGSVNPDLFGLFYPWNDREQRRHATVTQSRGIESGWGQSDALPRDSVFDCTVSRMEHILRTSFEWSTRHDSLRDRWLSSDSLFSWMAINNGILRKWIVSLVRSSNWFGVLDVYTFATNIERTNVIFVFYEAFLKLLSFRGMPPDIGTK